MSNKYVYGMKRRRHVPFVLLLGSALLVGGIVATVYGLRQTPASAPQLPIVSKALDVKPPPTINYSLPNRLEIPKLLVDTHVINVGLTKDGNMSVPNNVIDAGWYKYGALPGNQGTAVLAGHLDGLRGEPGVFSNLAKLAPGDDILVTESNGQRVSFKVREMKRFAQTEQPAEVFKSNSGSHLNLITCTGSWDRTEHRFAERLVVFADKAM